MINIFEGEKFKQINEVEGCVCQIELLVQVIVIGLCEVVLVVKEDGGDEVVSLCIVEQYVVVFEKLVKEFIILLLFFNFSDVGGIVVGLQKIFKKIDVIVF